jgi:PST family polysaccharide transporter
MTTAIAARPAAVAGFRKLAWNYALLIGGEIFAKLAAFLAFTHLGRTLGRERYGSVEFAIALIVFFSLPVSFGLEEYGARELARYGGDKNGRMALAVEIAIVRAALALVAAAALGCLVWALARPAEQKMLLMAYGASLLLLPAMPQWFFQGHNEMAWVSVLSVVRQSAFALLVFAFFDAGRPLYRVGFFECGAVAATVAVGYYGLRRRFAIAVPHFRISMRRLRQHLACAVPIGLSQLTWACLWYSATIILGFWSSPAAVGEFSVAHRISISVHTFVWLYFFNLLPSISRAAATPLELRRLLTGSMRLSSWAGFLGALAAAAASGPAVRLAFGPDFSSSAPVLATLVAIVPIMLISGHYRYALIAADRQQLLMRWSFVAAGVTLLSGLLLAPRFGAMGAAWAVLSGGAVQLVLTYVSVNREIVKLPFLRPWLPAAATYGAGMAVLRLTGVL